MDPLTTLKEKIVRVVPELADVSFAPIGNEGMSRSYKLKRKIQLADVLRAIDASGFRYDKDHEGDDDIFGLADGITATVARWDWKLPLEDQEPPLWDFLNTII